MESSAGQGAADIGDEITGLAGCGADTAASAAVVERALPSPALEETQALALAASGGGPAASASLQPKLHKDFYLCHPECMTAEYCWGNLEASHPVLGPRSSEDVEEYRRQNGIWVRSVRGRLPPKPFQAFSETSFPGFVEELAYELFTTDAVPFPVQAQAWPCALSGMDVLAVAPTGSGKTLAFLLPALVHVMAQDVLKKDEGPIALVLSPTRELAQQTCAVAERIFERTQGEDKLRASAVYGGVDPRFQLPASGAPDFGRWPELLVATPGRLLDLFRRCWISPRRVSYVVLDEADLLLSHGWFALVREVLHRVRLDRQLLLFSATWPQEAEAIATELCGEELVKIRVDPPVPRIPQSVRLFSKADDTLPTRKAALENWVRKELRPEEALLVLCARRESVIELASSRSLAAVLSPGGAKGRGRGANGHSGGAVATLLDGPMSTKERAQSYWRFVNGEARALVTTFRLGSRGLDYSDTTASAADRGIVAGGVEASGVAGSVSDGADAPSTLATVAAPPLSLVVVLFDFPPTIKEYAHCIGRTARPGQRAGRAVAFLPEMRFWIARELASLMEQCEQPVPEALSKLIDEDQTFLDACRAAMQGLKDGRGVAEDGLCGGDFDADHGVWTLTAALPSYRRRLLHCLADELALPHVSTGDRNSEAGRRLHVALRREDLPDSFFWEGEEVELHADRRGDTHMRGVVIDPKIHPQSRTVRVRVEDGRDLVVSVDSVCLPVPLAISGDSSSANIQGPRA